MEIAETQEFTNADKEIIKYLECFAEENDVIFEQCEHDPITYKLLGKIHGHNPLLNKMRDLNLIMNKHIPQIYKVNSVETRMKLI